MPDITPNLGLKKPLGNEHVLRTFYRENLDLIDTNAAKKSDFETHVNANDPHPQYATDVDLTSHINATDPHPQYATDVQLNAIRADNTKTLVMEVRSTDPVAPEPGRIWFRSDL